MRIDAGIEEYKIGLMFSQKIRQGLFERFEIIVIADPRLERDVEVALLLSCREIGAAMHGEGENGGIMLKNLSGAVALMNVQIDHKRPLDPAFRLQQSCRNRNIVEDAKPGPLIGKRMMAAACGIAGKPVI